MLAFVLGEPRPTAGQVRAHLGVPPRTWPNAADDALAELQRHLLTDRGAAEVPDAGAPYLAKDGIPYRAFDRIQPALVRAAAALTAGEAARRLIAAYLGGAVFAARSKLASMFKHCVSRTELEAAIDALAAEAGSRSTARRWWPRGSGGPPRHDHQLLVIAGDQGATATRDTPSRERGNLCAAPG